MAGGEANGESAKIELLSEVMLGRLSGLGSTSWRSLTEQLTTITQQLQQLQTVNQTQMQTMEANTQAVTQNTARRASGASTASTVGSTIWSPGIWAGVESADFGADEFVRRRGRAASRRRCSLCRSRCR